MQPSTLTQDHNHVQQLQQSQPSALQHRLWSGLPSAQCHLAWFPSAGHAQQLAAVAPGLWRSAPAPAGNFAALAPAPVALAEIQAINETVSARACRTSLYSCSMPDPGWTAVVAELTPVLPTPTVVLVEPSVVTPVMLAPLPAGYSLPTASCTTCKLHSMGQLQRPSHSTPLSPCRSQSRAY